MAIITFIENDGTRHDVDVTDGISLMESAVNNGVPGIDADCGGECACATCHVFIPEQWSAKIDEQGEMELDMLDLSENRKETSRLACQIQLGPELDGMEVGLPVSQF